MHDAVQTLLIDGSRTYRQTSDPGGKQQCLSGMTNVAPALAGLLGAKKSDTCSERRRLSCMTYAAVGLSCLLGARTPFVIRSPVTNAGLEAASFCSAPPHFAPRAGWVVLRCANIAAVVPVSSHFRAQGMQGVASTSFAARAAWTAVAHVQSARAIHVTSACLPPVRLPIGTTMADPVTYFPTPACDDFWVQAFFIVHLRVPVLHHCMLAVS